MTVQSTFDRRTFLQAGGILAIGFSMSATAGANTLHAPKSVAKEAVDSWLTIAGQIIGDPFSHRAIREDADAGEGRRGHANDERALNEQEPRAQRPEGHWR